MGLKQYQAKRRFHLSGEPRGKKSSHNKRIYVIQKHAARHLHYDLRLELGGTLLSWAVPKGPCLDPTVKRLAVHVEDHPIEYANFAGTIPKGQYGAGVVEIWDKGQWLSVDDHPKKAYLAGHMTFQLQGDKLHGLWKLIRMHHDHKTWLLFKVSDEYAMPLKKFDITQSPVTAHPANKSKRSAKRTHWTWGKPKTLKPSPLPQAITPEMATLVDRPPAGQGWLHEIKLDGYRLIAIKKNNKTHLLTKNHHDWTMKFQEIAKELDQLPVKNSIMDGEVVAIDESQHPNFQLLQNTIKNHQTAPLMYYVFDILYYDKYDLSILPLLERKKLLKKIISFSTGHVLRYSDHIIGSGKTVFQKAGELGLEGIVSKKIHSTYIQNRTTDWLKTKCIHRQEFLIGGFTKPQKSRHYFGALLLGTYNKRNQLIYHGKVGTGLSEDTLKSMHYLLQKIITHKIPFQKPPPEIKNVTWVKPVLIAEIEFTEWTEDDRLRQPRFKGLRFDQTRKTVQKENEMLIDNIEARSTPISNETKPKSLRMTNAKKILYAKGRISKRMLGDYYEVIKNWILPYIINRPLTLVRCPNGYEHCFYQKNLTPSMPASLHGITIKHKELKEKYIYLDNTEGLMVLPQLAVLEIHPWSSRIDDLDFPDMVVFDLDPAPDVAWKNTVAAALTIKRYLHDFKLHCFVKSTGGKGLHIVIPIKREYEWHEIKLFAKSFADFLILQHPDKYISKMTKAKRSGKIYIDYLRNQPNATAIAPYSTRALPYAPVALPLAWDELTNDKRDTDFTIKTLPPRLVKLKKDPWEDFFQLQQSLRLDQL